jgi:myo-inositol-1(or 4)-monophosphatase
MNKRVFISYASVDRRHASVVAQALAELGHDVVIDYNSIDPGNEIDESIRDKIRACHFLIVILSRASLKSQWVAYEIGLAKGGPRRVTVIPYLTSPKFEIPHYLGMVHCATSRKELIEFFQRESGDRRDIPAELRNRYAFAREKAHVLGSMVMGFFNNALYANKIINHQVRNFPTEADIRANRIIRDFIEGDHLTRGDGIISEEEINDSEKVKTIIQENEFVWIIDPLDGTLNFAYRFPFFCISLGLMWREQPVLGILYDPHSRELFCGLQGTPSHKVNLQSGVEDKLVIEDKTGTLSDCIVMTHLSATNDEARRATISVLDKIASRTRGIRMLGSGQMALMALAQSRFHIFFNYSTNIWDILPGYVILRGAGGFCVTSLHKNVEWDWRSRGVIAAVSKPVGEHFRRLLRRWLPEGLPRL